MRSPTVARRVVATALVVGFGFEILFDRSALGINLALGVATLLAAAALVRPAGTPFDRLDAWLPVAAVVVAALVAVRADPALVLADTLAAAALSGASVAALAGASVTRRTALAILVLGGAVATAAAIGGLPATREAARDVRPADGLFAAGRRVAPVARGLAFGLPVVVVFVVLFASADAVFGRWIESVLRFRIDLGDLPGRLLFVLGASWVSAGLLWAVAGNLLRPPARSLGAAVEAAGEVVVLPRLPLVEVLTVLLVLDALFAVFVVLQLAYLFGGSDTLAASGLTYADYARRGFFELVAAASLVGLIVLGLEATVARRSPAYVGSLLALVAMTGVVLASAYLRLRLYQDAYGWTELRFYALALMAFLAGGLGVAALLVLRAASSRLPHALAAGAVALLVVVNLIGPQAFVTSRNLERALDPSLVPPGGETALDAAYLAGLGEGAVPALVSALPRLAPDDARSVRRALAEQQARLASDAGSGGWTGWNVDREQARRALRALFGE